MGIAEPINLTTAQGAFLIGYAMVLVVWLYSELSGCWKGAATLPRKDSAPIGEGAEIHLLEDGPPSPGAQRFSQNTARAFIRFFLLEKDFLKKNRLTLRAMSEFGTVLVYFYVCDRLLGVATLTYSRDIFLFLYFLLLIVAGATSLTRHHDTSPFSGKPILYLNRHQTEEWRGWMQVLFLMYHYFHARETYNVIRVFVAAYIWMTGFGNFSYYYVRKDFSIARFSQMMWRLNFLVVFCCIVLNNSYMIYYICPLHTFFTLMVYVTLGILNKHNGRGWVIAVKIAACFLVIVLVWEIPGVFDVLWSPFQFLLGYVNPNQPEVSAMYEWHFRTGLDRYIWIVGMIYAYYHPTAERWIEKLEGTGAGLRITIKSSIATICLMALYLWYEYLFKMESQKYHKVHPYTSWIPITAYICLRNITQTSRNYSLALFGWLGKITLETYVSQFHIWLRSGGPNATPIPRVTLLSLIPDYPALNFMLTTAIFIAVAHRIFGLTNKLKMAFLPSGNNKLLARNIIAVAAISTILYVLSWGLLSLLKISQASSM